MPLLFSAKRSRDEADTITNVIFLVTFTFRFTVWRKLKWFSETVQFWETELSCSFVHWLLRFTEFTKLSDSRILLRCLVSELKHADSCNINIMLLFYTDLKACKLRNDEIWGPAGFSVIAAFLDVTPFSWRRWAAILHTDNAGTICYS
jgi:hypothetical protein